MYYNALVISSGTKGVLLIALSTVMFGSYGIWSKLMGPYFGAFSQGWIRSFILVLVLLPILYFAREIKPIPRKDWWWLALMLTATSLTLAPAYYAFIHMDVGVVMLLFYSTFLLTMYAFGFWVYKEERTTVKFVSLVLAFAGLLTIYSIPMTGVVLLAALMASLNGVASGTEVSTSKKFTDRYSALYIVWLCWIATAATNLPLAFLFNEPWYAVSVTLPWLYMLFYAVAGLIGFWSVMQGLKYVDTSIGGLVGLLQIIFGFLFGMLFFSEELTFRITIGAVLILLAAALPHIMELVPRKGPMV